MAFKYKKGKYNPEKKEKKKEKKNFNFVLKHIQLSPIQPCNKLLQCEGLGYNYARLGIRGTHYCGWIGSNKKKALYGVEGRFIRMWRH